MKDLILILQNGKEKHLFSFDTQRLGKYNSLLFDDDKHISFITSENLKQHNPYTFKTENKTYIIGTLLSEQTKFMKTTYYISFTNITESFVKETFDKISHTPLPAFHNSHTSEWAIIVSTKSSKCPYIYHTTEEICKHSLNQLSTCNIKNCPIRR